MPIASIDGCSSEHWEEIRHIIREALPEAEYQVDLVSDSNEVGVIQNRIVNNIYKSDIVICDVSGKNPNVMFELGMRLAFDKPTVIIKDDKTNYSFDTGNIEHINYPRALHYQSIIDFKKLLQRKVKATYEASLDPEYTTFLKHFGEFKIANVSEKEITSEKYILKAINELSSSVKRMENNHYNSNTISQKPASFSDVNSLLEQVFNDFRIRNIISDDMELFNHKESLKSIFVGELISLFGMPKSVAFKIANENVDKKLDDLIPF